jgi:transposase
VLILDNYSIHHGGRVQEIARNLGIDLLYLPGYSPDLNAIELAFSKLKAYLRKAAALTFEALSQALGEALAVVTLQDIRGFFREVGCWRQYL